MSSDARWESVQPQVWRWAILASMAQYRRFNDVTGSIETNPFVLPPLDFLLKVLRDPRADAETRTLIYIVLQQGNKHHVYQMSREQRDEFVLALRKEATEGRLGNAANGAVASFNIKRDELTPQVDGTRPPPPPLGPPPPPR